jgi:hypothetical protein
VLPFERGYRSLQMGLLPKATILEEALAFLGFGGELPMWEVIYPAVWATVLFFLGYRVFLHKDL